MRLSFFTRFCQYSEASSPHSVRIQPALQQLIDRGASAKGTQKIRDLALSTEGVFGIHALRTRYIGSEIQVDLHVLVQADLTVREGHAIAGRVKHRVLDEIEDVIDVLIHIEPYESE